MNVEKFLEQNRWTQEELAEKLGTTSQNVNKWVNCRGLPSYEYCRKLLELGMLVEDLFDVKYKDMHDHDNVNVIIPPTPEEFQKKFDQMMEDWRRRNGRP